MSEPIAAATSNATVEELREALKLEERVLENLRACCCCSRPQPFFTLEPLPDVDDQKHALRQICMVKQTHSTLVSIILKTNNTEK